MQYSTSIYRIDLAINSKPPTYSIQNFNGHQPSSPTVPHFLHSPTVNQLSKSGKYALDLLDGFDIFQYFLPPALSFWPPEYRIIILHYCNGLVLCRTHNQSVYYVCNPVNKSWTEIPGLNHDYVLLDFDPCISPHFQIFAFKSYATHEVLIRVYCSENKTWKQMRKVSGRRRIYQFTRRFCTLWNGALYVHNWIRPLEENRTEDAVREEYQTVKIGLLGDEFDGYEFIKFPIGTKKPYHWRSRFGRLGDNLCLACVDDLQLRVWTLSGENANEWVIEHDDIIYGFAGYERQYYPHIVGFHPELNAILLSSKNMVFAYNYKERVLLEFADSRIKETFLSVI